MGHRLWPSFEKPWKSNYHGLPFTYANYSDVISMISMEWAGNPVTESKKNQDLIKIPFFYVDAKYDFDKLIWLTG